jgi:hypothetical protein
MTHMLGKLFTTPRGNLVLNTAFSVVGILLVIIINAPRTGTIVFLAVTAAESGLFSLVYGLRSSWRREPAARAVFWAVFAYFGLASVLIIGFLFPWRFDEFDDVRELTYLGLAVAGFNLLLTLTRILRQDGARGDG